MIGAGMRSGGRRVDGSTVYLGLGTNLGDRLANLREAVARLSEVVTVDALSSVYRTDPVYHRDQPDFWNAVVRARTGLPPERLLAECKSIERAMGREPSVRYGPRLVDIDLLLYDRVTVSTPSLTVPHERLSERAFVLVPLLELEPDLKHPVTGERLADRLACGRPEGVDRIHAPEAIAAPTGAGGRNRNEDGE